MAGIGSNILLVESGLRISPRLRRLPWLLPVLAALLLPSILTRPALGEEIAIREIGGVPIIRCKIHCGENSIDAHILLDLGQARPFVIHKLSMGGLKSDSNAKLSNMVDIEFARNVWWKGLPIVAEPVRILEDLTSKYSGELKEIPVIASVGLSAIKNNVVELDLSKGVLRTLGLASDQAAEKEFDYEAKPAGILLKGVGPTGKPARVLMYTREEDSILKGSLLGAARELGKKPNFLEVNGIKFSDTTAFRFQSLRGVAREPVDAVLGSGAFRNYTVTIWPRRKKIAFLPRKARPFPQAEQDYFFALADRKPEGVAEFIAKKPCRRLMDEACMALWQIRLADAASTTKQLKTALDTIGANFNLKQRSPELNRIADALEACERTDREDLAMFALDLAMKHSGGALDHSAVHAVHVRLGKRAFLKGDLKQARRHLVSAAFGMPRNGECNFWLGEVYSAMGKPRRAWSRYFQTLLDNRAPRVVRVDALGRLDELNQDPKFRATFDMEVAEQYMAGRLSGAEFHALSRYQLARRKFPTHAKLVEFFVNANDKRTGGMELAFQSLDEFFEGDIALICYHLDDPMHSEAAKERLEYYKARPPLVVFDGKPKFRRNVSHLKKLPENAAKNESAYHGACLRKEPNAPAGWVLDANMVQDGTKVSGAVTVSGKGEADKLRLHAIVCERSVMALEANGVFFHHFVARKALTPPEGLDLKKAVAKPMAFAVDAKVISREIVRTLDGNVDGLGRSRPTFVDANKLIVVVFVQHSEDRRVLAAKSFTLAQEDEVP